MNNKNGKASMQETKMELNSNIAEKNLYNIGNSETQFIKNLNNNLDNNNDSIQNINKQNEKKVKNQRKLYVDLESGTVINQPEKYCDNSIRTSQYTLYSFLPLAIMNQYKTPFNWFFLIQAIIDCIPAISSVNPATTIMPVLIVLIISLIREAVEDYRKYSNDKLANETIISFYKMPSFLKKKCSLIKIGNIIKVRKEEMIPADLLIIKTSLSNGFCYMQTSNLDGETTLKPREAINITQKKLNIHKPATFSRLFNHINDNCYIEVDVPSKDIYEIEGTIFFKGEKTYFDSKNILLRGSRLKNVNYVYGIAIYTGRDTKLMLNINRTTLKISDIDYILGKIVIFLIGMCVLVTVISTIIGIVYRKRGLPDYEKDDFKEGYLHYYRRGTSRKDALESIRIAAGHFHMFGVIPISIVIVNAVVKIFQTAFLEFSPEYRQDEGDQMKCYSTTLIEQLGKVKYIFSDKTGTLTKNEMVFKGCSIFTKLYDSSINDKNNNIKGNNYMPPPSDIQTLVSVSRKSSSKKRVKKGSYAGTVTSAYSAYTEDEELINIKSKISPTFCTDYFIDCINDKETPIEMNSTEGSPFKTQSEAIEQFLLNIVINHDVLIEKKTKRNDVIYQGVSPDEVTLVSAANELGYTFVSRENNKIVIFIYDNEKNEEKIREFDVLQKFDFTSERQRSSIIVRDKLSNKIMIYIKGSDKKIFSGKDEFSAKNIYEISQKHVDQFARQGLRTLCYSFKYLDEIEYNDWVERYNDLKYQAINDKSLNSKLDLMIEEIEGNATILGVSALEDKLQDKVKEDIEDFIEAGINFWMITGDKMDTAETIGYSCGIISEDSEVYKIKENKEVDLVIKEMEDIKEKINKSDMELEQITEQHQQKLERIRTIKSIRKSNASNLGLNNNINNNINNQNINNNLNNINNIITQKENVNGGINNIKTNINKVNNPPRRIIFNNNNYFNNNYGNNNIYYNSANNFYNYNTINNGINATNNLLYNTPSYIPIIPNHNYYYSQNGNLYLQQNINMIPIVPINPINDINYYQNLNINNYQNLNINNYQNLNVNNFNQNKIPSCSEKPLLTKSIDKKTEGSVTASEKTANQNEIFEFVKTQLGKDETNKYDEISFIKKNAEKMEIDIISETTKNDYGENSNIEGIQNQEVKDLALMRKNTKQLLNEKNNFNRAYDYFQNRLHEFSLLSKRRCFLFKLKYIYPQCNEIHDLNKKILSKYTIIIEGSAIDTCMKEGRAGELFFDLVKESRSLICCRSSPSQKSKVVEFIKKHSDGLTLAIGDGGNDVNMIKMAHVGIGIFGKEGYQAAYNSDYAISQFKYLKRLLFVDGRFSLARNSYFIYHYFFKNVLFCMAQFWFQVFSLFSGRSLNDEWYSMAFNSFFTVVPIAVRAVTEEDFDANFSDYTPSERKKMPYLFPDIYKEFRESKPFNVIKFTFIYLLGCFISIIFFIIPAYSFYREFYGNRGYSNSFWDISLENILGIVIVHFFMVFMDTWLYIKFNILFYIIQIVVNILVLVIINKLNLECGMDDTLWFIMGNWNFWFTMIALCSTLCVPFYILRKAEYFFGGFIVNLILQKKINNIYLVKYCKKKVEEMTRVHRNVAKFTKIYKNKDGTIKIDNFGDEQMKKWVDQFKMERKKNKKAKKRNNVKNNINKDAIKIT